MSTSRTQLVLAKAYLNKVVQVFEYQLTDRRCCRSRAATFTIPYAIIYGAAPIRRNRMPNTGMSGHTRKTYPPLVSTFRGPSVRGRGAAQCKGDARTLLNRAPWSKRPPGPLDVQPCSSVVSNEPCSRSGPDGDIGECIKELPKARPPFDHAIFINSDGQASRGLVGRRPTDCSNGVLMPRSGIADIQGIQRWFLIR